MLRPDARGPSVPSAACSRSWSEFSAAGGLGAVLFGAGAVGGGVLLGPLVGLGAEGGGRFSAALLLLCGAGCEELGQTGVGFPGVAVDLDR